MKDGQAGAETSLMDGELVWRLLHGPQGAMMRQIGLADSRLSQIGRAIRFIRAHHAEAISIPMLADMVAMSESSFHRHFRGATTMSPLQYQKLIRLQEARARLLVESDDVAAIGAEHGELHGRLDAHVVPVPGVRPARWTVARRVVGVMAELDDAQWRARVTSLEAELTAAEAELAYARSDVSRLLASP